jgi:8-oxo-dGTP pyrophosphatase MutT (NUDIX family)
MNAGASPASPSPGPVDQLLERYPLLRPPISTAGAAVTIVLREGSHGVETLLIQRAEDPEDPASGDVGLPGGHVDESDGSLLGTALRELREEVGLQVEDLSGLPRYVTTAPAPRFGLHVGVFAARLGPAATHPSAADPKEVAHVFWLPSERLADTRQVSRATATGEREVPATVYEGHVVWGFTRRVLRDFFGLPPDGRGAGAIGRT